jgi:hypothetical protein
MKVAIITSLWGLFNLGVAIVCSYMTRRIAQAIHEQMIVRGVIVCEAAESAIFTTDDEEPEKVELSEPKESIRV